jgi:hypothetical protein
MRSRHPRVPALLLHFNGHLEFFCQCLKFVAPVGLHQRIAVSVEASFSLRAPTRTPSASSSARRRLIAAPLPGLERAAGVSGPPNRARRSRNSWSALDTPPGDQADVHGRTTSTGRTLPLIGHATGAPTAAPPRPDDTPDQSTPDISGPSLLRTRAAFACELGSTTERPPSRPDSSGGRSRHRHCSWRLT